jgi:hypothetical protein
MVMHKLRFSEIRFFPVGASLLQTPPAKQSQIFNKKETRFICILNFIIKKQLGY